MKKFNYKQGNAVIRTLKEPKIKKKKFNIDRVIYIILLLGLFIWLSSFVYNKTVWLEANGQMLMDKVDVNFTNDIRLKKIFINEGDTVTIGSKLFNYHQNDFDSDASIVLKNIDRKEQQSNNLADILRQINLNRIRLRGLKQKLTYLKLRKQKITKLILLDVYTKPKLDEVITQILEVQNDIEILKNELYFLRLEKNSIEPNTNIEINGHNSFQNTYVSPIKGVIGQILKNSEESCYKTENVLTIHNVEKVFIKAYFNLKDLSQVKKGDIVTVEFPDKSASKGIINKLYISTYKAPKEFQKKYEPTERNILTEIVPQDTTQIKQWAKFYKLNLKIKVGKF